MLTDAAVKREPFAHGKPRIVRDSKIAGLHVWIGKRKKTFRYQYETARVNGTRVRTQIEWLGEHPHHSADEARAKALAIQAARVRGEYVRPVVATAPAPLTFGEAFEGYKAAITKEGKSPRTIADYQDKFDKHLAVWKDKPLAAITREEVTKQHAAITERAKKARKGKYASGKYAANGTIRLARAIWNFAKNELETPGLPERNPCRSGKLFHRERARDSGMGAKDLAVWWAQLQQLPNPIRREMHLFMLLSGLRRQDVLTARWDNLDARKSLRIPAPKGGVERAFDLPLSEPMLDCLKRAKEAGNTFFPEQSRIWVFPAETGHIARGQRGRQSEIVAHRPCASAFVPHAGGGRRHRSAAPENPDESRARSRCDRLLHQRPCPVRFTDDAQQRISTFIVTSLVAGPAKRAELCI